MWTLDTAKLLLSIPQGDTTKDTAITFVMKRVISLVEDKLQRSLLRSRQEIRYFCINTKRVWLPRFPIDTIIEPTNLIEVNHRVGYIVPHYSHNKNIKISWVGGYSTDGVSSWPLPDSLEFALWEIFAQLWNASDPNTGLPSASGGGVGTVIQGSGEIKSVTIFDGFKIDYDVGATVSGGATQNNLGLSNAQFAEWGILAPWYSILAPYRRHVGGA